MNGPNLRAQPMKNKKTEILTLTVTETVVRAVGSYTYTNTYTWPLTGVAGHVA